MSCNRGIASKFDLPPAFSAEDGQSFPGMLRSGSESWDDHGGAKQLPQIFPTRISVSRSWSRSSDNGRALMADAQADGEAAFSQQIARCFNCHEDLFQSDTCVIDNIISVNQCKAPSGSQLLQLPPPLWFIIFSYFDTTAVPYVFPPHVF